MDIFILKYLLFLPLDQQINYIYIYIYIYIDRERERESEKETDSGLRSSNRLLLTTLKVAHLTIEVVKPRVGLVGWLVGWFYGISTLFGSFNAELNFKQLIISIVFVYKQLNIKK